MPKQPSDVRGRTAPSMADVARVAGVAPITVSRVANGQPNVRPATRERVVAAMQSLGYRPNSAARALATGRFGRIGVITSSLTMYGSAQTINGIVIAAERAGYSVTLMPVRAISQGDVIGAFDKLAKQEVDGVVVIVEARLLGGGGLTLPQGIPAVVADSGGASDYIVVDSDQEGGGRMATEHLLDLGHPSVWHVTGPANSFSAASRRRGWRSALSAAGIRPPQVLRGDWTNQTGYRQGQLLAADPDVSAVFAANDQTALGIMRACHEAGRRVPEDISVVGFDNMLDSDAFWPPLTTVTQRFDEVGRLCVDSLLHEIRHETGELRTHIVETALVVRESTGPPPGSRVNGRSGAARRSARDPAPARAVRPR
ncbi:MAG: LacI family DNA-binding transcriptional regulator [Mycobacteriales bacterium]